MRRIFAVVSEGDFNTCIDKGRSEGLDLGEVLAILVHLYASTPIQLDEYKDFAQRLRAERPRYARLGDVEGHDEPTRG
jgi:hypothetical protein